MSASSRGRRAVQAAISAASPRTCARCAPSSFRAPIARSPVPTRLYSAAASAAVPASDAATAPPTTSSSSPGSATAIPRGTPIPYEVHSGMILTRPPLVTRKLHPFEDAFFFYQKRLEERLNTPFITDIYFKPDTARRLDWGIKVQDREGTVAKELGVYNGKSSRAWDDELKVGDGLSEHETMVKAILKDAEARVSDDAEVIAPQDVVPVEAPVERVTEADREGDVRRLDRQLDRTLYLVVKGEEGWGFPSGVIPKELNLHESAKKVMDDAAGVNMNTWVVGRVPVAHVVTKPTFKDDGSLGAKGRKTFFLKGRIMAGQADLEGNPFGYTDFKWLTSEELQKELAPAYFRGVRNMMADR